MYSVVWNHSVKDTVYNATKKILDHIREIIVNSTKQVNQGTMSMHWYIILNINCYYLFTDMNQKVVLHKVIGGLEHIWLQIIPYISRK